MGLIRKAITGIDLGNSVIKVAHCSYRAKKFNIIKALKIDIPHDSNINEDLDFYIESIKRSSQISKIPLNNVAIVANDSWYQSMVVTFPPMPKKELQSAILFEIKRQSDIDITNITYDYYINRKLENGVEYYIFYAEKNKISEVINKFKRHGIKVNFIDVEEMIALALYKSLYADDKTVKCFFDFGYIDSKVIFTKENRLIFSRSTTFGAKHIFDILKNSSDKENLLEVFEFKGIQDAKIEALLKEYFFEIFYDIIQTVNFFTVNYREDQPSNILFSGGIFAIPGIYEYFCQNLPYPCILNNVLDILDYNDKKLKDTGFMFNFAVGAALR